MNKEEEEKIRKLCNQYRDCFYDEDKGLTSTNAVTHKIKLKEDRQIYVKNYRYPYHLKEAIQEQVRKLLEEGIIRHSNSPNSSPAWVVPKKVDASGKKKWRLVIDYRKLNDLTIDDKYPLPRMDDILKI